MIPPTDQLRAGHRPADLIPPGIHPVHVTIVLPATHRLSVSPLALLSIVCGSAGLAALIYLTTQLVYAAVPFAGFSVGGITLSLWRK
jgi:hypothetical protein